MRFGPVVWAGLCTALDLMAAGRWVPSGLGEWRVAGSGSHVDLALSRAQRQGAKRCSHRARSTHFTRLQLKEEVKKARGFRKRAGGRYKRAPSLLRFPPSLGGAGDLEHLHKCEGVFLSLRIHRFLFRLHWANVHRLTQISVFPACAVSSAWRIPVLRLLESAHSCLLFACVTLTNQEPAHSHSV